MTGGFAFGSGAAAAVLLADFAGLFVYQLSFGLEGHFEAGILDFCGLFVVFGLLEMEVAQIQCETGAGEVFDWTNLGKQLV